MDYLNFIVSNRKEESIYSKQMVQTHINTLMYIAYRRTDGNLNSYITPAWVKVQNFQNPEL